MGCAGVQVAPTKGTSRTHHLPQHCHKPTRARLSASLPAWGTPPKYRNIRHKKTRASRPSPQATWPAPPPLLPPPSASTHHHAWQGGSGCEVRVPGPSLRGVKHANRVRRNFKQQAVLTRSNARQPLSAHAPQARPHGQPNRALCKVQEGVVAREGRPGQRNDMW